MRHTPVLTVPVFVFLLLADQLGLFSLRGLRPGTYDILAWEEIEPGAHQNPEFLKNFESRRVRVTVEHGGREVVDVRVIPRP